VSKDKKTEDKDKKKDIVQQPGNSAPVGGAVYADGAQLDNVTYWE
jgi:hypothetical protein